MRRITLALLSVLVFTILTAETCCAAQPAFPLKVSGNGRYLVDQNGVPFPILGDAGWETSHNLTPADQAFYLTDRTGRGFNAVLQEAIDHKFNASKPPEDIVGNLPFTKRLDNAAYTGTPNGCTSANGNVSQYPADPYSNINAQAPDFTYATEAYWARLDSYLTLCAQHGVVVLLFPAYVGYAGGDEGWMQEMVANDAVIGAGGQTGQPFADNTKTRMWNYGAWLANRYKSYTNIIWVHGGDYGNNAGNGGVFTTQQKSAVNNLFAGIKSVAGQQSVLHTAHWSRRSTSTDITFTAGSFDLEATYADTAAAQWGLTGYAHAPAIPSFEIEDYYEGNPSGGEPNRRFAWWTQLSNIGGYFYSSESVWPFDPNVWKTSLNSQGAQDAARLNAFMQAITWQNLVPSGLNGMNTLVTAGGGTANPQSTDYVAASATPDGTLLVAYVPPAHTGTLTVDIAAMIGSTTARWFNPANANYTAIGTFPNSGTQVFTPPGDNGTGYSDWVLVLTASATVNLPPTIAFAAAANPNPVTATTTALTVLGADDGGEPALIYSWSAVGTPPATVGFSPNGTNAAKNSTATFTKAGSYTLRATITDMGGLSVTSDVAFTVIQTLSAISVSPPSATIVSGGMQSFTATAKDQFGQAMATQPIFTWTVSGGGTISSSGVLTAGGAAGGPFTVTASSGKSGTAAVTVTPTAINHSPVITSAATAAPNPTTVNQSVAFAVGATDPDGDTLTYAWTFGDGVSGSGNSLTHTYSTAGNYTANVTASDGRGGSATSSVVITVNAASSPISIKVNFQIASSVTPAGYLADIGLVYGDRGNGFTYGWNADNTANARERDAANAPDQRYDTLIHMQKPTPPNAFWEIAVPNGSYSVRIVAGDPSNIDSVYKINAEGVLITSGTPSATIRWFDGTQTVSVADGRLTVSNAAGSLNNKICFVEISTIAPVGAPASDIVADPMKVSALQARLNFARKNQDGYSLSGVLPLLAADFKTNAVTASIDLAGAIVNFTLDAKGHARNTFGSCSLKHNANGWQLKVANKKGAWSDVWGDAELNDQTIKTTLVLPITVTIGGQVFGGSKTVQYHAIATKSGTVK